MRTASSLVCLQTGKARGSRKERNATRWGPALPQPVALVPLPQLLVRPLLQQAEVLRLLLRGELDLRLDLRLSGGGAGQRRCSRGSVPLEGDATGKHGARGAGPRAWSVLWAGAGLLELGAHPGQLGREASHREPEVGGGWICGLAR